MLRVLSTPKNENGVILKAILYVNTLKLLVAVRGCAQPQRELV
jgi:hypothetical protein